MITVTGPGRVTREADGHLMFKPDNAEDFLDTSDGLEHLSDPKYWKDLYIEAIKLGQELLTQVHLLQSAKGIKRRGAAQGQEGT